MQSFWERSLKFWVSINHCMPGSIWDRAQTLLQMGRLFPCTGHTWSQVHTPSPTDCSSSGPGKMTRFLREKGRQVNTEPALRTQAHPSARLISCVCCPHSHRGPSGSQALRQHTHNHSRKLSVKLQDIRSHPHKSM